VLERLSEVTLPDNLQPQIGTDYSPVGQIYWYTLTSTNPEYDLMELKALEDWVLEKQFKSVPNVVDVSSFGGITKEYQVAIDPNKLVEYGLSIGDVEQQLTNNNVNAGGSFIQQGLQQINVRSIGLFDNVQDIGKTVLKTQTERPFGSGYRHGGAGAEDPAGPHRQGHSPRMARSSTTTTWWKASCCCARAPNPTPRWMAIHAKVERAERAHSAQGRESRSVPRPQRPGALHHAHRAA
jgi:hypothetical protein